LIRELMGGTARRYMGVVSMFEWPGRGPETPVGTGETVQYADLALPAYLS
jgi:hypothetical protein